MSYVVAKYIRLSIEDAKTESLSIENQHFLLDNYISTMEEPDIDVIDLVDNGHTGTNFERPAVQELFELVNSGRVHCIIVKDFSRFGRNAIEVGYYLQRMFPLFNTRFIAITDAYDSAEHEGDTGGLSVTFKLLLSERYSRDLSKKIKASKMSKAVRGEAVFKNCIYGYKKVDGQLVIDEPAAQIVRLIFNLASSGSTCTDIASRLYADKVPTPSEYKRGTGDHNCMWSYMVIYTMLYEEQYIGTYTAGKSTRPYIGSRKGKRIDESKWIKIPNHHPAIIDEALFKAAQERVSFKPEPERKREIGTSQRYGNIDRPLKGKIVCGCCDRKMRLSSTRNAVFTCYHTLAAPDAPCHKLKIGNNEITGIIYDHIRVHIDLLIKSGETNCLLNSKTDTVDLITDNKLKVKDLFEQFTRNEITSEEFAVAKSCLTEEANRLKQVQLASITGDNNKFSIRRIKDDLLLAEKSIKQDGELTKDIIELLVEKVYVFPGDRITIAWKYSEDESVISN